MYEAVRCLFSSLAHYKNQIFISDHVAPTPPGRLSGQEKLSASLFRATISCYDYRGLKKWRRKTCRRYINNASTCQSAVKRVPARMFHRTLQCQSFPSTYHRALALSPRNMGDEESKYFHVDSHSGLMSASPPSSRSVINARRQKGKSLPKDFVSMHNEKHFSTQQMFAASEFNFFLSLHHRQNLIS